MVAPGDIDGLRAGDQCRQFVRGARDFVLGPDRDQDGDADPRGLGARQALPRSADAGGERGKVGTSFLGEFAINAGLGVGYVGRRRGLQRFGDILGKTGAFDQANAKPAQNRRAHPFGIGQRQKRRNTRAHRVAEDIGPAEPEMIEQRAHILSHDRGVVGGGVIEFGRSAVAAHVGRNHPPADARERRHPARRHPS